MKINPNAKTGASYAKLFKEKIEQQNISARSNGQNEQSNIKVQQKGIKFDDLSDWDNIVYEKTNKIDETPEDKNNGYNPNLNKNNNNVNPLSDFSVNTSTFTYRVGEMGNCDKIDLSTMTNNDNLNSLQGNKMKMFNMNTNMISQIKQKENNDGNEVNEVHGNVIKEEEDEYKNYSKNTYNEKDSLNDGNGDNEDDLIPSGGDLMKQIEIENDNQLTNLQLNDLAQEAGQPVKKIVTKFQKVEAKPIITQSYQPQIIQPQPQIVQQQPQIIQPQPQIIQQPQIVQSQPQIIQSQPIQSIQPMEHSNDPSLIQNQNSSGVNVVNNVNNNYNNVHWMQPYQMPYYPYASFNPQMQMIPPQYPVNAPMMPMNSNMFTFNANNNNGVPPNINNINETKQLPKIKKKIHYKPKTMKDYKEKYIINEKKSEKRGGLGPNIGTKEWEEKEEKKKKIQEYANKIKQINNLKKINNTTSIKAIDKSNNIYKDQLYDSLSENNDIDADKADTTKAIDSSKQSERSIQSAGGYGHINIIKQLRKENQMKQNNKSQNSNKKQYYKQVPIKNIEEEKKPKGRIYTTLKTPIMKEKKRAKSGKIRISAIKENIPPKDKNKNSNKTKYEDELTRMFFMNKPNDYNGLKMLSEQNMEGGNNYKRSNSKSDLKGNFELETLLLNHQKYAEKIGKIKNFISNIK